MLKNAYLRTKIGADTAENEQHFAKILPIVPRPGAQDRAGDGPQYEGAARGGARRPEAQHPSAGGHRGPGNGQQNWKILQNISKFSKFLAGSFSAVSKRNFARKYAFDSIF